MTCDQLKKLEDLTNLLERDLIEQVATRDLWVLGQFKKVIEDQYSRAIVGEKDADSTIERILSDI